MARKGKRMSDGDLADFLGLSKDSAVRRNLNRNKPSADADIAAEDVTDRSAAKMEAKAAGKATSGLARATKRTAEAPLRATGQYAKGGRVDGCATKGKTRGRVC